MAQVQTRRRKLREIALDRHGYVTSRDLQRLGMSKLALQDLRRSGGVERVGHGLYRFDDIPATAKDQFMEAVLRVGEDAHLDGDAVLALHDLALVNPRRIRVAAPRRDRHRLPDFVEFNERHLPQEDLTVYDGIPSTTVARALLDCRGTVMTDRLIEAAHRAIEAGLLSRKVGREVLTALGVDTP